MNATKWYMHKPEFVLENEMHKILWNFEIQTDHLIQDRRSDLEVINKNKKKDKKARTCRIVEFAVPVDIKEKIKESQKKDLPEN